MVDTDLHLKLVGTGSYLPRTIIRNEHFDGRTMYAYDTHSNRGKSVVQKAEGIYDLVGIKERHITSSDETASYMALQAAIVAIDEAKSSMNMGEEEFRGFVKSIDVILGTVSESRNVPNGATKIVKGLSEHYGVKLDNSLAYDSANACAGFAEAVLQANSRVLRRPRPKLVVVSEDVSGMTSPDDMNLILFSAGGASALFVPTTEKIGVYGDVSYCDPYDGKDEWICKDYIDPRILRMPEGRRVLHHAPAMMMSAVKEVMKQNKWERIDGIIPHQANRRITNLMQKMDPDTPVIDFIELIANMSGVTSAYTLDKARKVGVPIAVGGPKSSRQDGLFKIEPGMRIVIPGLGGGVAVSAFGLIA